MLAIYTSNNHVCLISCVNTKIQTAVVLRRAKVVLWDKDMFPLGKAPSVQKNIKGLFFFYLWRAEKKANQFWGNSEWYFSAQLLVQLLVYRICKLELRKASERLSRWLVEGAGRKITWVAKAEEKSMERGKGEQIEVWRVCRDGTKSGRGKKNGISLIFVSLCMFCCMEIQIHSAFNTQTLFHTAPC